jgi:large subunit ribosomal protein L23
VITLLRREAHGPNFATFQVPLRFTKLDIRDYLWNLYNVETKSVRSHVKQSPPMRDPRGRTYRPLSKKYMIVELAKPFAWPEVPENKEPWNAEIWEGREAEWEKVKKADVDRAMGGLPLPSKERPSAHRRTIAEMAEALRSGSMKWENGLVLDEKWSKEFDKSGSGESSAR